MKSRPRLKNNQYWLKDKMVEKLTVCFCRSDGTERAKFDNIWDALLFGEALKKAIEEGRIIEK